MHDVSGKEEPKGNFIKEILLSVGVVLVGRFGSREEGLESGLFQKIETVRFGIVVNSPTVLSNSQLCLGY